MITRRCCPYYGNLRPDARKTSHCVLINQDIALDYYVMPNGAFPGNHIESQSLA